MWGKKLDDLMVSAIFDDGSVDGRLLSRVTMHRRLTCSLVDREGDDGRFALLRSEIRPQRSSEALAPSSRKRDRARIRLNARGIFPPDLYRNSSPVMLMLNRDRSVEVP